MSTFWILISVFSTLTITAGTYVYFKRWKLMFAIGKGLVKTMLSKSSIPKIGTNIKHIDNIIMINDRDGTIILPYKHLSALKAVNSQVWLVSGSQRKVLKIYPGFDFNLSPTQLGCDKIELHHEGDIVTFVGNDVFNWNKI